LGSSKNQTRSKKKTSAKKKKTIKNNGDQPVKKSNGIKKEILAPLIL
jgi:hypothetical protein